MNDSTAGGGARCSRGGLAIIAVEPTHNASSIVRVLHCRACPGGRRRAFDQGGPCGRLHRQRRRGLGDGIPGVVRAAGGGSEPGAERQEFEELPRRGCVGQGAGEEAEFRPDSIRAQRRGGEGSGAGDRSSDQLPGQHGALCRRGPRGRRHSRSGDVDCTAYVRRRRQVQAGYAGALCGSGAAARGGTKGGADRSLHDDARTDGAAGAGGQRDVGPSGRAGQA